MKTNKIIFFVTTGLLSLLMLFSAGMYFFNHAQVSILFKNFGYPTYIIYPYGIAKVLGVVALWFFRGKAVNEWAYASFFLCFYFGYFCTCND